MRTIELPVWPSAEQLRVPPRVAVFLGSIAAAVGAAGLAAVLVFLGPVPALATLVALVAGTLIAVDARAGLWVVLAIVALLPYAVIPVKVVVTPAISSIASLALLTVWLVRLFLDRAMTVPLHPLVLVVVLFAFVTSFAFVLGIGRGYTSQVYHDYGKFLLSLALFFVVWSSLRTLADYRRLTVALLLVASAAALVALVLYLGGPELTLAVLARLVPYGYPSTRIVRYIEDDPAKPMRAIGTSVDPNSFAGLLALALVVAVAQCVARRPVVPRWFAVFAAIVLGPALLLTYSRAGWLGAAFGIGLVAAARYRWLLVPGGLGLAGMLVLGIGEGFFERLWQGFTVQDRATQMRLEEYRTALALLREYPAFGVGFGHAPTVGLWTGVSSIYLLVAERMGLIGLATFLVAVFGIGWVGWRTWQRQASDNEWSDLLLGWLGAHGAALLIGSFDHYYVNISFPHMVAVFWIVQAVVLRMSMLRSSMRSSAKEWGLQR